MRFGFLFKGSPSHSSACRQSQSAMLTLHPTRPPSLPQACGISKFCAHLIPCSDLSTRAHVDLLQEVQIRSAPDFDYLHAFAPAPGSGVSVLCHIPRKALAAKPVPPVAIPTVFMLYCQREGWLDGMLVQAQTALDAVLQHALHQRFYIRRRLCYRDAHEAPLC